VVSLSRVAVMLVVVLGATIAPEAQGQTSAERAYFRAVALFFEMPEGEIAILGNWDLPPDEIPVVLFMARRAVVSPEALVALRQSGRSWTDLAKRYGIGANALHVPLADPASAGVLASVYERFRDTPVAQWTSISLSSADIVALVNVRVLSQSLGVPPDDIMRRTGTVPTFVELYAQLLH
jgi:hypothetical protein